MKYLIVLLALTTSAFAKTRIPDTLVCTSTALSENVRTFKLIDLNTTGPTATITDAGLMGYEIRDGQMIMGLSNECDNSYEVTIDLNQIEELMAGKRKSVTGKLVYSDVALSEARNTEDPVAETVEINCRRK